MVRARTAPPLVKLEDGSVAAVGIAAVEPRHFERDGDLDAEFQRLIEGASGQRHARDAGREPEIVLDPRRRACLSAKGALIEHEHRQALGRGIDRGGKPRRSRANHGDVVDFFRVELRRDAETTAPPRRWSDASAPSRSGTA